MRTRSFVLAVLVLATSLVPGASRASGTVEIEVDSNRADLISGGDALVTIRLPDGAAGLSVDAGGTDVTSAFAARPNGKIQGLVTALGVGDTVLTATVDGGSGASVTITNQGIGGPIFSGPQIQPWTCTGASTDAQCNRAPTYTYSYTSTSGSTGAYDPENPPSDVGTVTTETGATVRNIVRVETGVIDRDQYRIAVLFDPSQPWEPWAPQPGFNRKLVITHGASCDTGYAMGAAPDVMNATALQHGFVVMSHALDNAGHNCNIITQGESLIMTKERVVEQLGELRYTIGTGCSGGSLVQQQLANAYPGLYQGILPQCSYPDAWSSAMQYEDYYLLRNYFENPDRWGTGVVWGPTQMEAVNGHPNPGNPVTFTAVIPNSGESTRSCPGVAAADVFDENTNPDGVRCSLVDYMVNVFGVRAEDGYGRIPWTNVGVQYGVRGLMSGTLTTEQFVDVNAKLGGFNVNFDSTPGRTVADPAAVASLYRSGAITQGNHLDEVAIIDLRGPDPGAFHDVYRTYALRARLEREHGTAENQALWRGFVALLGDVNYVSQGILAMDDWLQAVEADTSARPLAEKVIANRNVPDRCTNGVGVELPGAICDAVVESYATPRIEAGMPFTDDVMACQLKPLRKSDYYPVFFTDSQWSRLQTAFPSGVCDYSVPGQGQQDTVAWQTYQDAAGNVIYGGQALPPEPVSVPFA